MLTFVFNYEEIGRKSAGLPTSRYNKEAGSYKHFLWINWATGHSPLQVFPDLFTDNPRFTTMHCDGFKITFQLSLSHTHWHWIITENNFYLLVCSFYLTILCHISSIWFYDCLQIFDFFLIWLSSFSPIALSHFVLSFSLIKPFSIFLVLRESHYFCNIYNFNVQQILQIFSVFNCQY